jgi:hypothetical protein
MGLIGPKVKPQDLKTSAAETNEGRGQDLALPGVKADAKTSDPKAFKKNLELAKRIAQAVAELKETDNGIPRFILGWRLYANADSPYWNRPKDDPSHPCSCGAGCWSVPVPWPPEPRARPKKRAPGRSKSARPAAKKRTKGRKSR